MANICPFPGVAHGKRMLATVIEEKAKDPSNVWVAVPIDPKDLKLGFKHLTFHQLNKAADRAAEWLQDVLPKVDKAFQSFAYVGTKDLRYSILALAAAKLQKVMILISPLTSIQAQLHILQKQGCTVFIHTTDISVAELSAQGSHITFISSPPSIEDLFDDGPQAKSFHYAKSWEEGIKDPWLVFHTSGTTGLPKPIEYTHSRMSTPDMIAALSDIPLTHTHQYAKSRWYIPIPALHFVGMLMQLSMTAFIDCICVLGPPGPPTGQTMADTIRYGRADGAVLPPVMIDTLCLDDDGLAAARSLKYLHFAGAPLSQKSGNLLKSWVQLVPCIGSTETGGYFTVIPTKNEDTYMEWDHVRFQENAGAHFRHHLDQLYELVFVKDSKCKIQQVFESFPDIAEWRTSDLWAKHPTRPDMWKIIGRVDDYVCFSHGEGLNAAKIEQALEENPLVKTALVGAQGAPSPVVLLEVRKDKNEWSTAETEHFRLSLETDINEINKSLHEKVQLNPDRLVIASSTKPFGRTEKGTVARARTFKLYEDEIARLLG